MTLHFDDFACLHLTMVVDYTDESRLDLHDSLRTWAASHSAKAAYDRAIAAERAS